MGGSSRDAWCESVSGILNDTSSSLVDEYGSQMLENPRNVGFLLLIHVIERLTVSGRIVVIFGWRRNIGNFGSFH